MKLFEILTFITATLLIISLFKMPLDRHKIPSMLNAVLLGLIITITIQNGVVWYYYTLYIFIVFSTLIIVLTLNRKAITVIMLSILLLSSVMSSVLFPYYEIPKPSGEYLVGTKTYDVVDEGRIEQYDDSKESRKFKVQIWYPLDSNDGLEKAPWLYEGISIARGLSKDAHLPFFVLDKMANVESNSYIGGEISAKKDKYPIIIISHGWSGVKNLHQDFAEELASRGYIVLGVDHTYGAAITIFNDETEAAINYDALPVGKKDFMKKANQLVNTYAGDISRTIDFVEELNESDDTFIGKIDDENIGLLGHSTGGGADVRVALEDSRIKAVIGLDAWVEPVNEDNISIGLEVPSLLFRSEHWEKGPNNKNLELLFHKSAYKPTIYQINNTTHYDFAMIYMYSPATKLFGLSGTINSSHLTNILKEMINSFFEQTLCLDIKDVIELKNYEEVEEVRFD